MIYSPFCASFIAVCMFVCSLKLFIQNKKREKDCFPKRQKRKSVIKAPDSSDILALRFLV